jgi:regulator of cell morphogenesis and NO signaling
MLQQLNQINEEDSVTDIVTKDYRASLVLKKYNIDYCCGGKFSLADVCRAQGLDVDNVKKELEAISRPVPASNTPTYTAWDLDFLMEYIIHIHHEFLKTMLPFLSGSIREFTEKHSGKYPYLTELQDTFERLASEMLPHLAQEEEIVFPYIRHLEYAHNNKEPYAALLVKTRSRPVEDIMQHNHEASAKYLSRLREMTDNYTPPSGACINHKVNFLLLRELDYDLSQHLYLENDILFPKAIIIENELLRQANQVAEK